jgi:hypothetical protein
MRRRWPVLLLAARFNWAYRSKFVLLAVLVAVGMTVLLIMTELSRASTVGLDDAIAEDAGETGTYVVELTGDLGLTIPELAAGVAAALHPFASRPPSMVEVLPEVQPDCPPHRELGPQQIFVLRDSTGEPAALPFGRNLPAGSEFCLGGQEIPASALYVPTPGQQRSWGTGIFVDSAHRHLARYTTTQPVSYRFVVVTGRRSDESEAITRAVTDQLGDDALRHGTDDDYLSVSRIDGAGGVRGASDGIKLVYAIIAWGVLILGGLGLLVAELIVVRDLTWFFGLARALGAGSGHIAALVLADIVLVLFAGTALALLLAAAVQPAASSFAESAFALRVHLVQTSTVPRLVAGGLLVLLLAGVYPAVKATRQDPLDNLEPR